MRGAHHEMAQTGGSIGWRRGAKQMRRGSGLASQPGSKSVTAARLSPCGNSAKAGYYESAMAAAEVSLAIIGIPLAIQKCIEKAKAS